MTTRSWEQYPDKVRVATSIGDVVLAITDSKHIYISTPEGEVTIIRGKELRASLHVNDYGQGYEPSKDKSGMTWNSLYATKVGTFGNSATDTQRKLITAAWVEAVNIFMKNNPELRTAGAEADRNNKAMRLEEEIAELRKKIEAKELELKSVLEGK